jgi:hypothetical protein
MWDLGTETEGSATGPSISWIADFAQPVIHENNCIQLLTILEARDGQAWSVSLVAEEAMIPETTARRLLSPVVMEYRPHEWVMSLRSRENLSSTVPAGELVTNLVNSYYGRMLASLTYVGVRNGVEVVRVNTSQFELLQRVGASYNYQVWFDSTIKSAGRGPRGRARARQMWSVPEEGQW